MARCLAVLRQLLALFVCFFFSFHCFHGCVGATLKHGLKISQVNCNDSPIKATNRLIYVGLDKQLRVSHCKQLGVNCASLWITLMLLIWLATWFGCIIHIFGSEIESLAADCDCISSWALSSLHSNWFKKASRLCDRYHFSHTVFYLNLRETQKSTINLATDQMHHITSVYSTIYCINNPHFLFAVSIHFVPLHRLDCMVVWRNAIKIASDKCRYCFGLHHFRYSHSHSPIFIIS